LVLSMSARIDILQVLIDFLIRDQCLLMCIADLLLLVLLQFLGEIPHVADVPATVMTEKDAGGFNMSTFMVLL